MIRKTIVVQRFLLGLLTLACVAIWFYKSDDCEQYGRMARHIEELMGAVQEERALNQSIHQTVSNLFAALRTCECEGDLAMRRQLWDEFEQLMQQEQDLSGRADALFQQFPRRQP